MTPEIIDPYMRPDEDQIRSDQIRSDIIRIKKIYALHIQSKHTNIDYFTGQSRMVIPTSCHECGTIQQRIMCLEEYYKKLIKT